jgi:hypothetical protein
MSLRRLWRVESTFSGLSRAKKHLTASGAVDRGTCHSEGVLIARGFVVKFAVRYP